MVVKRDGRREPFDRQKLRRGLELACRKRPVSTDDLAQVVETLELELVNRGDLEVAASYLGERVMELLRGLDAVAYVRFASVYREFQTLSQFDELLDGFPREGAFPNLQSDSSVAPGPALSGGSNGYATTTGSREALRSLTETR
ncbi:MAG: transcriptional repressor NrdR, partial [Armatimonadetes bacterium]|nr:transcriptional repressor NrdR [Armatimonadota bacterium]